MGLKSKEWFYKQCLAEIKDHGRLCHLCWDILEKGVGQEDSTRGHVTQAIGVCQKFLTAHPDLIPRIRSADATLPFDVSNDVEVQDTLKTWLASKNGDISKKFGYSYDKFKNIVTPTLGGKPKSGGGGNDEFKKVLRVIVEFDF